MFNDKGDAQIQGAQVLRSKQVSYPVSSKIRLNLLMFDAFVRVPDTRRASLEE